MRRKIRHVPNAKSRAFVYVCTLVALLVYAIPKIPSLSPGIGGSFSMLWILFVGLVLSANLYFLFGADQERSKMLEVRDLAPKHPEQDEERRRRVYEA